MEYRDLMDASDFQKSRFNRMIDEGKEALQLSALLERSAIPMQIRLSKAGYTDIDDLIKDGK